MFANNFTTIKSKEKRLNSIRPTILYVLPGTTLTHAINCVKILTKIHVHKAHPQHLQIGRFSSSFRMREKILFLAFFLHTLRMKRISTYYRILQLDENFSLSFSPCLENSYIVRRKSQPL